MALNLGATAVDKLYVGSTAVDKVYLGSTEVWSASAFTNMGMRKSGNQSFTSGTVKVSSWTAAPEYPGSTVTNNELGPSVGTAVKTVSMQARMDNGAGFVQAATINVMKNASTVLGTLTIPSNTTATALSLSIPNVTINAGDTLWLSVTYNGGGWNRNLIAADTWLVFA